MQAAGRVRSRAVIGQSVSLVDDVSVGVKLQRQPTVVECVVLQCDVATPRSYGDRTARAVPAAVTHRHCRRAGVTCCNVDLRMPEVTSFDYDGTIASYYQVDILK